MPAALARPGDWCTGGSVGSATVTGSVLISRQPAEGPAPFAQATGREEPNQRSRRLPVLGRDRIRSIRRQFNECAGDIDEKSLAQDAKSGVRARAEADRFRS
jgi:hypothetical protein